MEAINTSNLKYKILEGAQLAFKKLVEKKRLENSYLVLSENGKVVKKPASEIKI